ncbi:MAG: GNAT family N-acetyltransferase [Acidimicrobiales bacterium]
MATVDVRFIEPSEAREWMRSEQRSFGIEPTDGRLDELVSLVEAERCCAAFDGGSIVATGGAFSSRMQLPGGASVPVAAVTAIGTRPTHRRRGIFRRVMDVVHQQSAELGEPAAVLLSSESLLYPRFGYGVASFGAWVQIDRRRAAFRPEIEISDRVDMFVDVAGADALVSGLWEQMGAHRPGWIHRPDRLRANMLADYEVDRHGAMPFTLAVHHNPDGDPDGYCLYRHSPGWEQGQSTGTLFITELVTATDTARLALWHHCLTIDLVEKVEAMPLPTDDPLPFALVDRRQYRTIGVHDQLWLRPHDADTLLEQRRYAVADSLVIDIVDLGRRRIDGGPDGASVESSDEPADVTMSRADLATVIVGHSLRPLLATGRIELTDPATLDRCDQFFRWPVAPYNLLDF